MREVNVGFDPDQKPGYPGGGYGDQLHKSTPTSSDALLEQVDDYWSSFLVIKSRRGVNAPCADSSNQTCYSLHLGYFFVECV